MQINFQQVAVLHNVHQHVLADTFLKQKCHTITYESQIQKLK